MIHPLDLEVTLHFSEIHRFSRDPVIHFLEIRHGNPETPRGVSPFGSSEIAGLKSPVLNQGADDHLIEIGKDWV